MVNLTASGGRYCPTSPKSGPRRGTLRLAQACGMLSASGRGSVKGGGILQFDLAP